MNATDEMPEPPDAPLRTHSIKLPSRDQVTAVQVNTLLQAAQVLNQLIVARSAVVTEAHGGPDDGGVCSAIDSSLLRVCAQLETIFDDKARWDLSLQNLLEKQLSDVYVAHLDLLKTQKQAMLEVGLPHRNASPKLLYLPEHGQWVAILGNPEKLDDCLLGIGSCPAAALADFDLVFKGAKQNTKLEDDNGKSVD